MGTRTIRLDEAALEQLALGRLHRLQVPEDASEGIHHFRQGLLPPVVVVEEGQQAALGAAAGTHPVLPVQLLSYSGVSIFNLIFQPHQLLPHTAKGAPAVLTAEGEGGVVPALQFLDLEAEFTNFRLESCQVQSLPFHLTSEAFLGGLQVLLQTPLFSGAFSIFQLPLVVDTA